MYELGYNPSNKLPYKPQLVLDGAGDFVLI